MTKVKWHEAGEKRFETGVSHGVLFVRDETGGYLNGVAWNGLTSVNESPSGAEPNKSYADNVVYAVLTSAEEYSATVEAYAYPREFAECDGTRAAAAGVFIGQQPRKTFGMSYETLIGNDLSPKAGKKIHLIYGAQAAPSEKSHETVNDSPEPGTFSWELTTTPVQVEGFEPAATLEIDSTLVTAEDWAELTDILYGTEGSDPRLPSIEEVIAIFEGSTVTVTNITKPTQAGNVVTIPNTTGVDYKIDGKKVTGTYTLTETKLVKAYPQIGYKFDPNRDTDWEFIYTP